MVELDDDFQVLDTRDYLTTPACGLKSVAAALELHVRTGLMARQASLV